jgi:putative membrane protein
MASSLDRSRLLAFAAFLAGLGLTLWVLSRVRLEAMLERIGAVGPAGAAWVILAQLALYAPLGLAWWLAAPGEPIRRLPVFVWGSLVAEAAANLLPFSQLGAALAASRAAQLGGVRASRALGSNLVDIGMELAGQVIYTVAGVSLLMSRPGSPSPTSAHWAPLLASLLVSALLVLAFVAGQTRILALATRLLERIGPVAGQRSASVLNAVRAAHRKRWRLSACLALHAAAWFASAAGAWLILRFMGWPLPAVSVLCIESLAFAFRNAAFFVPAGLGVQEGAYVWLGSLFGLPAETALALSLVKRARDLLIGAPVLVSWQVMEVRRRIARASRRKARLAGSV